MTPATSLSSAFTGKVLTPESDGYNSARAIWNWLESNLTTLAYAMVGLILGGAAHSLADIVFSKVKRMF